MSSEEQTRGALRALAEHDRELEAGALVEARVVRGFRQARKRRVVRRAVIGLASIAAAALVAVTLWAPRNSIESVAIAPPREVVTQFFPLTDSTLPLERSQLLRVRVPASMMYKVGLPVHPDHWSEQVDADVVVGEEGMARAIRFVGYEQ